MKGSGCQFSHERGNEQPSNVHVPEHMKEKFMQQVMQTAREPQGENTFEEHPHHGYGRNHSGSESYPGSSDFDSNYYNGGGPNGNGNGAPNGNGYYEEYDAYYQEYHEYPQEMYRGPSGEFSGYVVIFRFMK